MQKSVSKFIFPLLIFLIGVSLAVVLLQTKPKAERRAIPKQAHLVEVETVTLSREPIFIQAMGTVMPARQIDIKPRVNGQIISVSQEFIPGGRLRAGQTLLQIDPVDYELVIRNMESDVAQAISSLELEMGQQTIAKREYELLGEEIRSEDEKLVLREPQLASAQANVNRTQAALAQARLNLERTTIKAPFNALVRSRAVDLGVQVTSATALATLCETDRFWIQLVVPVDKLKWINIPTRPDEQGSPVRIFNEVAWGADTYRTGRVIRMTGDLEEEGRMAQLLVEIEDPLALLAENANQPSMLLDSYLRVQIQGIELDDVVAIERRHIRNGGTVWVMNKENALEIRSIQVAYHAPDKVFVTAGISEGERLVTSNLSAPVAGMLLRTATSLQTAMIGTPKAEMSKP